MLKFINPVRMDAAGDGRFGSPRSSKYGKHTGVDFTCTPDCAVLSPVAGRVCKLGFAYGSGFGDWNPASGEGRPFRYVDIQTSVTDGHEGHTVRLLYVDPVVAVGDAVTALHVVGYAQDVSQRYPGQGMLPHVHVEVFMHRDSFEGFIDPAEVLPAF